MKRHSFPLAITAVLTTALLAGCGDDEPASADDPASSPAAESSDPTPSEQTEDSTPTDEPTASETTEPSEPSIATVFFVADTPNGHGLYAEERAVAPGEEIAGALDLLMQGDTLDPDYSSLVPAGSLETAAELDDAEGVYALELTGEEWTTLPDGMTEADAELAVQQIVYTLFPGDGPGVTGGVDFYLDGELTTFLGVEGTVEAADELEVRGFVNVLYPFEGESVRDTFTATGEASSFEATVPWQVRDASGEKVLEGFTTAEGWIDGLYPWQAEVDVSSLAPGEYTFVAMTDDPSGGAEGNGPSEDTKTIVVE